MSRSLTAWSRWVSLAERSHSTLLLPVVCRSLLPSLSVMPMMTISGMSMLLSAGFRTEARHRCRVVEEGFHF
jgi:hypothetical protein